MNYDLPIIKFTSVNTLLKEAVIIKEYDWFKDVI